MLQAQLQNFSRPIHARHSGLVLLSTQNVVPPFIARALRFLFLALSISLALSASSAPADSSLDDAVRELAERIAAVPNLHGPLRIQFLEDPAFQAVTGKDWLGTFRKEIENHHIALTEDPSGSLLRVGLAETPTQLVLTAATSASDREEVRFVTVPRTSFRAAILPAAPIRIERQLIYQSPERILDASSLWTGAPAGLAVFVDHHGELSILRVDSSGQLAQTIPLSGVASQPTRDPRGELAVRANDATVLLPDKACDFAWASSSDAKCHLGKTIWRLPTVLMPPCEAGGWKLLADGSEWTTPDVLQVVPDGSLRRGSAALLSNFPGPILSIGGEQDPASALVVTQNLRTGNYEVYKITLACGN
jgi:hypothetical protein